MFHLVLSACLAGAPQTCEPRVLPAGEAPTRKDCEMRASPIATDWLARHDELTGGNASCVETAQLPALETQQIAPGVYVHQSAAEQLSPQNRGRIANLSFVIGSKTVAVIDAGGSRSEGEALYAAIRKQTDKPISHLILTHMHPDHILGAEVFSEAGAAILANARLSDAAAQRAATWMQSIPEQIGAAAFAGTHFANVDHGISQPLTVDLGRRSLHLTPVPVAHTDNDLTVRDDGSGTLFAGDLVFGGLTPSLDGSLTGWLKWLAAPPEPRPALVVPGHGAVGEDWDKTSAPTRAYLGALGDQTRAALAAGLPLSQAVQAIAKAMQPLAGEWVDFDAVTARNIPAAYAELEWE